MSETKPNRPDLIAYTVTRQGDEEDGFFRPIGAAWANKKGASAFVCMPCPLPAKSCSCRLRSSRTNRPTPKRTTGGRGLPAAAFSMTER
jgi:hypothetical protein